ncbi:MAG: N-acetylmuramoyl-L-alanine amidase [Clostridia bacterium]|nr:N-acetylmuramoyl-L-alanine amidase [Clostridia bacterium]
MPRIYLSPSTQEGNMYVTGGSEEFYANLIADAMVRYLQSSGVQYTRNTKDMTAASSIAQSNSGNYDLHLAIHTNAAPEGQYGDYRGIDVYYSPGSILGRRGADIFVRNLKKIYPVPSDVRALPTTEIGEVTQTRAPAIFLELGYHDNVEDAEWIKNNIDAIGRNLALSVAEYFGIPLVDPQAPRRARVDISSGTLNLRNRPNLNSRILASMPNGANLTVLGAWRDWYVVNYEGIVGYAAKRYIS